MKQQSLSNSKQKLDKLNHEFSQFEKLVKQYCKLLKDAAQIDCVIASITKPPFQEIERVHTALVAFKQAKNEGHKGINYRKKFCHYTELKHAIELSIDHLATALIQDRIELLSDYRINRVPTQAVSFKQVSLDVLATISQALQTLKNQLHKVFNLLKQQKVNEESGKTSTLLFRKIDLNTQEKTKFGALNPVVFQACRQQILEAHSDVMGASPTANLYVKLNIRPKQV